MIEIEALTRAPEPGLYRHYKGADYEVLGVAILVGNISDTIGGEKLLVLYKRVGDMGQPFAREVSDFNEYINNPKYMGPRFVKLRTKGEDTTTSDNPGATRV